MGTRSAGYLGGEPGHDMERRLDELHGHLQQHRHAEAAGADARDGQPAGAGSATTKLVNLLLYNGSADRSTEGRKGN